MRDGLMGIKIRRKIRGEIKWRYFAPNNDDARNPMRGMPPPERDAIREEVYKLLGRNGGWIGGHEFVELVNSRHFRTESH